MCVAWSASAANPVATPTCRLSTVVTGTEACCAASCADSKVPLISPDRWIDVPVPPEAKASLPGFAFAWVTSSRTFSAGVDGCTAIRFAVEAMTVSGAKSRTTS